MITALLGDLIPYLVAALAALGGLWGWGRKKERDGRRKVVDEIERADREEALDVREKLDAVAADGDALERLRKHGKLRD